MSSIFFFTKCGGQFCTLTPLPLSKFQKFQKKNQNFSFHQRLGAKRAKIGPTSDVDKMFSKIYSQYVLFRNKYS